MTTQKGHFVCFAKCQGQIFEKMMLSEHTQKFYERTRPKLGKTGAIFSSGIWTPDRIQKSPIW